MVFEVLDNAIDEALAGYCDDIKVVIHADNSVSVRRQRPRHSDRHQGRRRAEALGRRDRDDRAARRRQVRPELATRSRAACTASACRSSTRCPSGCSSRIWRDGKAHQMEFRDGVAVAPLAVAGPTDRRGTEVHFMAAPDDIRSHRVPLRHPGPAHCASSFLNNGVKIELVDQRDGKSENFAFTRAASRASSST